MKVQRMRIGRVLLYSVMTAMILQSTFVGYTVLAADMTEELISQYEDYQNRFESIKVTQDIEKQDFELIEEHSFPVLLESFSTEELLFLPALEKNTHRLAIFLADEEGRIVYKYNNFEANYRVRGELKQPIERLAAVSFADVNADGRTDIVLITRCINETGAYAGKPYKVGDVLFQKEGSFYRDWRISDKLNRFGMNKSAKCIISFVRDGQSTEFLYTATTKEELLKNGFQIAEEQCYTRNFEKLGRLEVMPGIYRISEYDVFMIYLINDQGNIVWSFQPMGEYDNLYSLKGTTGKDLDGDGMKDLAVLAKYSYEGPEGELVVASSCAIYYQRTGGFDIDTGFDEYYQCTEEDTLEALVEKIREFWGWEV